MQESLWLADQVAPDNSVYNLAEAWRLQGPLDTSALRQSWALLVKRHETLRTNFGTRDGRTVQIVSPFCPLGLQSEDLSTLPDPEAGLQNRLTAETRRLFNLRAGPLARACLFRIAQNDHVLLINLHHIISDEWSFAILTRELAEVYASTASGKPAALPDLPIQYADFSFWQREFLEPKLKEDVGYWKEKLQGLPVFEVASDRSRPAKFSFSGATQFANWPREFARQLKDLSRSTGATLFMTLAAAFDVLLHRYSRQTDIVLGSPFAGRERTETENLIGLFVTTHTLRTDLSGDPTFLELVDRVRETVLAATAHQTPSVDQVIEAIQPVRDPSRHPLFQVVLGLQPAETVPWEATGLSARRIELDNGGAKFDWTLLLTETPHGLKLRSEYNCDLFEPATVERFVRHFGNLLKAVLEDPAARISKLRLVDDSERTYLLSLGNQGQPQASPKLNGDSIASIFEARAKAHPEATAVVFGNEELSYRDLNERADELARRLREVGAGPGVPVALYLDRSLDPVVAILGTLKAGSAYVPLDPAYPHERLRFVLEDTQAPVVITQEKLRSNLADCIAGVPAAQHPTILCIEEIAGTAKAERRGAQRTPNTGDNIPHDAAYIIYTSGSTGRPKGVVVTHGNVIRLLQQTEQWFDFKSSDVWTLFHSFSFDFSVWELWGALLYGGRLIVVPYLTSRSPTDFYRLLVRERVTVLNQTPSAFRQLIWAEGDRPHPGLALRYVICGGEALELQTLKPWFARHPDNAPQIVNMYGITETTVHVTYRVIRRQDVEQGLGSVIGVPIPDLKLLLLDEHLEPVPIGVPGEICVCGAGVAHGYLNRPELNAQRFVKDLFAFEAGGRMYRSGDLARRTGAGELVYLGRMDHQVKIRGFRVELGEIESALNSHPAVRESVVLAEDGPGGERRLVAYVVLHGQGPSSEIIRQHLTGRLPDYMIPAVFVSLPKIPLTSNGKVDRRALPSPTNELSQPRTIVAPRTQVETTILNVWKTVLGRQDIGVEDNFFHLGGHSLLAMQVTSRLEVALGIELSVAALLEKPTVVALAQAVAQAKPRTEGADPITPSMPADKAGQLLSSIDDLSEEQVEELLAQVTKQSISS